MILTITSIELKSIFKFFPLSYQSMKILRQLKTANCTDNKNTGFWRKHYTMSLWKNEEDMKAFYKSGAHLEAMKKSKALATEIRTLTLSTDGFLPWKDAKALLHEKGKELSY